MSSIIRNAAVRTACARPTALRRQPFTTTCRASFQTTVPLQRKPQKSESKKKYDVFKSMVNARFKQIVIELGSWDQANEEVRNYGVRSERGLQDEVALFRKAISQAITMAGNGNTTRSSNPLFWSFRNAFIRGDVKGLTNEIRYSFRSFMMRSRMTPALSKKQKELADLRYPLEWYPATRSLQRTIHLHVGPTNSGKTYHALKALEKAKSGIYSGPLRLLANEIFSRFQSKNLPCAMITGEEQRVPKDVDNYFISCTVEMTPLNRVVDVAVIDEIQMISDPNRGWAWTQAFLGVMAKEVHLCGEERAIDLIKSICSTLGDKCVVHRYQRLSPLKTMSQSLGGKLTNLEKGDALVAFSRVGLHGLKNEVERSTGKRCAIVYGSLPPQTRAQQAALFNDPNNDYDFLVASDAIGMGLNLEVKRVVFETVQKFDGASFRNLSTSELKQIGGRAGRFRTARQANEPTEAERPTTAEQKMGFVTSLDSSDLPHIKEAFESAAEPLEAAYISPPTFLVERFAEYLPPGTPLAFLLLRLRELAQISPMFLMDISEEALKLADIIQEFPLTINERLTMLNCPASLHEPGMDGLMKTMGERLANRRGGSLVEIEQINLEVLDAEVADFQNNREYLRALEGLHLSLTVYLWMSYRYPSVFVSQALAFHVKELAQERIEQYLDANVSFRVEDHEARREARRQAASKRERDQRMILDEPVVEKRQLANQEGPGRWSEPGHQEPLVEEPTEYDQLEEPQHGSSRAAAPSQA